MNLINLRIPANADFIGIVRLCLYGIASKMGFSYEDIEDMKVAASEACNNAVLHVLMEEQNDFIEVTFEVEDNGLSIKIKDNGPGFNYPDALNKASSLREMEISQLRTGGLGIYLMQALMDEVEINTASGTEVKLIKYVSAKT